MKISVIILILCLVRYIGLSQNLVPNPSFEAYTDCPNDLVGNYKALIVNDWFSPTKATPDYFNSCSRYNVSVPVNVMGSMFAHSGNAYAGLILLEKPDYYNFKSKKPYNYREYAQCKLIEPLVKDSLYIVKFNYSIAQFSNYSVGKPHAYLTTEPLKSGRQTNLQLSENINVDTLSLENKPGEWFETAFIYKAKGGEFYLTIGNFLDDIETIYRKLDLSVVPPARVKRILDEGFAYYFIDDVEVKIVLHTQE